MIIREIFNNNAYKFKIYLVKGLLMIRFKMVYQYVVCHEVTTIIGRLPAFK